MQGNNEHDSLTGVDLILLAVGITIYPTASLDQLAMYIVSQGGNVHNKSILSKRLKDLEVSRKSVSVEAYEAFSERNLLREQLFWTRPLPLGKVGIPRCKFIDCDEFAIEHKRLNKTKGWGLSCYRVRTIGNYTKSTKLTVIFAIEAGDQSIDDSLTGSIARPRRWVQVRRLQGTDSVSFASFIDTLCTSIETTDHIPGTDDHRVFLWDNLSSHTSPIVSQTVESRTGPTRFSILPRPSYQPKYGPIEYKICDLIEDMRAKVQGEITLDPMEQAILISAASIGPFDSTFDHCGYTIDGNY